MTVRGFADVHNHQFAHLGFGGREFFGEPEGPLDQALPWCTNVHGPGGTLDAIGLAMHAMYSGFSIGHSPGDLHLGMAKETGPSITAVAQPS